MASDDPGEIAFGPFMLDRRRRRLSRDGLPIPLGGRALDVLAVLAAAGGGTVSNDALLDQVWPGLTVEENNLQVQISNLRKALGDGWIVNLPGHGYRLVPVQATQAALPPDEITRKPSIAVLPFTNMSGDPEQEYFADGVVEDIITALSRIRWLFVIARNSSFAYKGKSPDIRQVGRELGVRYILEGSIRKVGKRVRVAAQLIEAASGAHLWAERYETDVSDIFEIQDQVSSSVAGIIEPLLRGVEITRAARKPTNSIDVYDLFLRGLAEYHRHSREGYTSALTWLHQALAIDSTYSAALALAAICYQHLQRQGWMQNIPEETAEAILLARRAAEYGAHDATALASASLVLCYLAHDAQIARSLADRAIELNPNLAAAWFAAGFARTYLGDATPALEQLARAKQLSPLDPWMHWFLSFQAFNHFFLGHDDEAAYLADQSLLHQANHIGALLIKVFSNAHLGRMVLAQEVAQQVLRQRPEYSIAIYSFDMMQLPAKNLDRAVHGLRLAGIPER